MMTGAGWGLVFGQQKQGDADSHYISRKLWWGNGLVTVGRVFFASEMLSIPGGR